MNENNNRVPAEFAPEVRFEVTPVPPARLRARQDIELEQLKSRLLRERLDRIWEPRRIGQLRRAANEAAALAWVTPFPLLVFPALFEEKAADALLRVERQNQIRHRSRELLVT
jgi:hypothetical protein